MSNVGRKKPLLKKSHMKALESEEVGLGATRHCNWTRFKVFRSIPSPRMKYGGRSILH